MVALTGQFVLGMAVLRASGFATPAGPIIASSAVGTELLALFGCHGLNLAAITAAICTGREAHEDPGKRYMAGVVGGLVLGIFGATLVSALPKELIAALVTFLTTASGMLLWSLPAAFWGLIFGMVTHLFVKRPSRQRCG